MGIAELRRPSMVPCRKPGSLWFIEDYILTKRYGQCHASSLPLFTSCNQASSVPNVLDCLYGPALKSCCEAVGTVPISLGVSTPDAAYGTDPISMTAEALVKF